MGLDRRDLYTFVVIAGLWLRDRQPPVVGEARDILWECRIFTSTGVFKRSLNRLVKAEWLAAREVATKRGQKVTRYVPTMLGFAEYGSRRPLTYEHDEYYCLYKHVNVTDVNHLAFGVKQAVRIYDEIMEWRRVLHDLPVPAQIREIALAVDETRAVDEVPSELLEWILRESPTLKCSYLRTLVLRVNAVFDAYLEMEEMTQEAYELSQALAEVVNKLDRYCASKGVRFDDEAEDGESQSAASEL